MKPPKKPDVPSLDYPELQSNFSHDGLTLNMRHTDYRLGKTVEVTANHTIEGPAPFPYYAWPAKRKKGR